ncbi:hypothetical protein DXG03_007302 [Asterophora parasitica]|uniref:Amine oxidase domain-containing protein n=1 Tax=Asterophora parasitica TaxID=117018 RepID=A0A9P7KAD4_9AGAR|nr:hypothetical protein DXG03_007302 [Asterophora parasitica]
MLLERQNRFRGWVRSEKAQLGNDGQSASGDSNANISLTVEAGPRTLRPASKAILELIHLLNLQPALLTTPRTAPAARSRFLYAPSIQSGLTAIPTSPFAFLRSPLRKILLSTILRKPLRKKDRFTDLSTELSSAKDYDESLDVFLSHRLGPEVARVMGSALCHGIYAADSRELSVRAAFPSLYSVEERGGGSVVRGILKGLLGFGKAAQEGQAADYGLGIVEALIRGVAVYSF